MDSTHHASPLQGHSCIARSLLFFRTILLALGSFPIWVSVVAVVCFSLSIGGTLYSSEDTNAVGDRNRAGMLADPNSGGGNVPALPIAYLYEDFNDVFALNWGVIGNDASHWSLKTVPGSLTIITEDGSFERLWTDHKNVFLVGFPVGPAQDFQVTTCISNFHPQELWNQAGLLLWCDQDNYLKLDYEYGEGPPPNNARKLLFTVAVEFYGYPNYGWFEAEQIAQKMWLRIIKRAGLYELYNSTDGKTFNPMNVILPARITANNTVPCLSLPLKYVGIFANNGTARGAAQVSASFDFFEFKTLATIK
jgi:regulation of enolase protein 1 (concanavalin A-like superfamily)